ncbi:MAG: hypothetical protein V1494_08260 [Candidatus Diapherotrites archaeon]
MKKAILLGVLLLSLFSLSVHASECDSPKPNWFFCHDFEASDSGNFAKYWDDFGDLVTANREIALRNENVPSLEGTKSVRFLIKNETGSAISAVGAGFKKFFGTAYSQVGYDTVYYRFYFRLNEQWSHGWGMHWLSLSGCNVNSNVWGCMGTAGLKPDGTNWFSVGTDLWTNWESIPAPGEIVTYSYHMDLTPDGHGDYFGENMTPHPGISPERGKWHVIEMMGKSNTPGLYDGEQKIWFDGKLVGNYSGIRWRSTNDVKITYAGFYIYIHNPPANSLNYIDNDNVVFSTSYIGPAKCVDSVSIEAPCYCGGTPSPTNSSNIYASGVCLGNVWYESNAQCTVNGQTRSCSTGKNGICATGTQTCSGGNWGTCIQNLQAGNEVCDDAGNLDEDCDGLSNCDDTGCSTNPACQSAEETYYIFGGATDNYWPGAYPDSSDSITRTTNNPAAGTHNLQFPSTGAWMNVNIYGVSIPTADLDWANSYLEFKISTSAPVGYMEAHLGSSSGAYPYKTFTTTGTGYDTIRINLTDFAATKAAFGSSIAGFFIGGGWPASTVYIDEIKIVSPGTSPQPCTENWSCTTWSSCVNNQQTRTCTDLAGCGTTANKPIETQTCTTCTEQWSCTQWSACSNGSQSRTCSDPNPSTTNCPALPKPMETQSCTVGQVCETTAEHCKYASNRTDSGTGSFSDPWNISQAFTNASAGDLVYFRGGEYDVSAGTPQITTSGTSDAWITFKAYPEENPHLDAKYMGKCPIELYQVRNIIIDGFEISGIGEGPSGETCGGGIYLKGSADLKGENITIRNNDLHGLELCTIGTICTNRGLIKTYEYNNVIIENNTIHDITSGTYGGNNTAGIYIMSGGLFGRPYDGINMIIRNNHIYNMFGQVLCIKHKYPNHGPYLIEGNTLHDCATAFYTSGLDEAIFRNNLIYNVTLGIDDAGYQVGSWNYTAEPFEITNNTFYSIYVAALIFRDNDITPRIIEKNIFVDSSGSGGADNSADISIREPVSYVGIESNANCVWYPGSQYHVRYHNPYSCSGGCLSFEGAQLSPYFYDLDSVKLSDSQAAGLFVNPPAGDFHLNNPSLCPGIGAYANALQCTVNVATPCTIFLAGGTISACSQQSLIYQYDATATVNNTVNGLQANKSHDIKIENITQGTEQNISATTNSNGVLQFNS